MNNIILISLLMICLSLTLSFKSNHIINKKINNVNNVKHFSTKLSNDRDGIMILLLLLLLLIT